MVRELIDFVQNLLARPPDTAPATKQFKVLHPLRGWLFWLPSSLVDLTRRDTIVLVTIAHFCGVALMVAPSFPAINQSFFTKIRVTAILEIYEALARTPMFVCSSCMAVHNALDMMAYPMEMIAQWECV